MTFIPLIGKPTHYRNAKAYDSTACGYAGSLLKTDDTKAVTCLRCRRTQVFKEARAQARAPAPEHPMAKLRALCLHARSRPQEGTALHACVDCGADVIPPGG